MTERLIAGLAAPHASGRQTIFWDDRLRGFGVLISGKTNGRTFVVQRDLANGLTRRLTVGAVGEVGLAIARGRAAEALDRLRQGVDVKRKSISLRDALAAYLQGRKDLRPRTRDDYAYFVEHYLTAWLDRPLASITRQMVEEHHQQLAGSPASANSAMRVLSIVWNYTADRDHDLPATPVRLRRQWFKSERRTGYVRAEQLASFYSAIMDLTNSTGRDYLRLVLFTGLRRREAARLRWIDVDLDARVIRLSAAATKANRRLDLPLSDLVHELLLARLEATSKRQPTIDFVFPSTGKLGHIAEPKSFLKRVDSATGIKVTVHDLRRTFVTVAESCDISPMALSMMVNHSPGRGITASYVQLSADRLREPVQRVADRLRQLCKIP